MNNHKPKDDIALIFTLTLLGLFFFSLYNMAKLESVIGALPS